MDLQRELIKYHLFSVADLNRRIAELQRRLAEDDAKNREVARMIDEAHKRGETIRVSAPSLGSLDRKELEELLELRRKFGAAGPQPRYGSAAKDGPAWLGFIVLGAIAAVIGYVIYLLFIR